MKTNYFSSSDHNFENPAVMTVTESDNEEFDFDFDYDPNEMYYALQNENN